MSEQRTKAADAARTELLRLDALAQAVTLGIVCGLGVFLATNWLVLKGGDVVGPNLGLLGQYFPGYRVTFVGSLVGFMWAFLWGAVAGYLVSTIYNRLVDRRRSRA